MPRRFSFLVVVLYFLSGIASQSQISEDTRRKRELFLKAKEKMLTLPPEPTTPPRPRPTSRPQPTERVPEPTLSKIPETAEDEPTATPRRTPTPEPTDAPKSRPTRIPTPEPTPEPTAPPRPKPRPTAPPLPTKVRPTDVPAAPITIKKSGNEITEIAPAPRRWWGGPSYKYVVGSVRKGIDEAPVKKRRWKYIVVHNSGTRQGNAMIFDYYHRHTRKMPNGMAYHFVIGNGTSSRDGQIELGSRWKKQINGGHVHSDYLNYISLGICLVGDYNRDKPTPKQLEALDELIRYLRTRCGKVEGRYSIVRAHKEINPVPTDCPGDRFPVAWLHRRFPD